MESLEYVFKGCYFSTAMFGFVSLLLLMYSWTFEDTPEDNAAVLPVLRLLDNCINFSAFFLACGYIIHMVFLFNTGL